MAVNLRNSIASSINIGLRQSVTGGPGGLFASAALDLQFAATESLVDQASGSNLITFSRASAGTLRDSNGAIQTVAADTPRFDHDPVTGESLGLLIEEARTNLLLNSETLSTQTATVTATAQTLSFYGTGTVTLSGASTAGPLVGTGVNNRVNLTFTPTAGSLTVTVSGSVTKAQLEEGSKATSYIPTTTSTVTRAADVVEITGANFSSFHNALEGTYFIEAGPSSGSSSPQARGFVVSDGSNTHRIATNFKSSTSFNLFCTANGSSFSLADNIAGLPRSIKAAIAYKSGDYRGAHDGQLALTSSRSQVPNVNQLSIGWANYTNDGYFNGHIKRLSYFSSRFSDVDVEALTAP